MTSDETDVARLAEALRQHRWNAEATAPLSRDEDYRPGAPCMDCGDYPGTHHDRSDCPRALAKALLPIVRELQATELNAYANATAADVYARVAVLREGQP